MRPVKILSVCGSGTVSSAMLSSKLADVLEEKGYDLEATEVAPGLSFSWCWGSGSGAWPFWRCGGLSASSAG